MSDLETITAWNKEHSYRDESLFVNRLVHRGLTYSQIVAVLETLDGVCHHCFDDDSGCQCWNDE